MVLLGEVSFALRGFHPMEKLTFLESSMGNEISYLQKIVCLALSSSLVKKKVIFLKKANKNTFNLIKVY